MVQEQVTQLRGLQSMIMLYQLADAPNLETAWRCARLAEKLTFCVQVKTSYLQVTYKTPVTDSHLFMF